MNYAGYQPCSIRPTKKKTAISQRRGHLWHEEPEHSGEHEKEKEIQQELNLPAQKGIGE